MSDYCYNAKLGQKEITLVNANGSHFQDEIAIKIVFEVIVEHC